MSVLTLVLQVMDVYMRYVKIIMLDRSNRFGYPLLMNLLSLYRKCLAFSNLEELDQDITQHIYSNFLEQTIAISEAINDSKEHNKAVVSISYTLVLIHQ